MYIDCKPGSTGGYRTSTGGYRIFNWWVQNICLVIGYQWKHMIHVNRSNYMDLDGGTNVVQLSPSGTQCVSRSQWLRCTTYSATRPLTCHPPPHIVHGDAAAKYLGLWGQISSFFFIHLATHSRERAHKSSVGSVIVDTIWSSWVRSSLGSIFSHFFFCWSVEISHFFLDLN